MAKSLEESIREELGRMAWILLCQQQKIAALEEALAAAKAATS